MRSPRARLRAILGFIVLLLAAAPPPGLEAAPSFAVTAASVTPDPVAPGATATITIGVKNSGSLASGVIVNVEVYDAANRKAFQQYLPGQSFGTGETRSYQWAWGLPASQSTGTYTVKVGVFADGWATLHMWNNAAKTFQVQSGPALPVAFSVGTIAASPAATQRGDAVGLTAQITNTGAGRATGIIVMLYLRDPAGQEFPGNQQIVETQTFEPGQTRTFSFTWRSPRNAVQGPYSVSIGVFNASWSEMYAWKTNDSAFTVGTAAEPTFSIARTRVSPTTVSPGGTLTLTTEITNTSQNPATNIIVLGEYNDAVKNIEEQYIADLTFAAGQKHTLSFVFEVPADLPPGRYTVDVGVFNGTWSKLYVWGFELVGFDVR